ncbi:two-component sensor histidine kinase [Synergistales bacterium]|nr:two-component sensor histidine kinase [Synergistales bacterium]
MKNEHENASGLRKYKRPGLLGILFVLVALPVALLLARSISIMATQRSRVLEMSGRYVRQLSLYGAGRYGASRSYEFLSLLSDRGYNRALTERERMGDSQKFIPGMFAYLRRNKDGSVDFIAGSDASEILPVLWIKSGFAYHSTDSGSTDGDSSATVDYINVNGRELAYSLYASPTAVPGVVAVAVVTMFTWTGGGSVFGSFTNETMLAAGFCLVALFLLRLLFIRPLRSLSGALSVFRWGQETPEFDTKKIGGRILGLEVEEMASLCHAVSELAKEAVLKTELEKRYVSDIVKAQENERNRLARDIHDGPIQVVAAFTQRVQMALLSKDAGIESRKHLILAEEAARLVVEDLREICDSLVPPWLSLGLSRCMDEAAERLSRQHDVVIDVDIDVTKESDDSLPQEVTLAFFRIFQEGVSNAVRHGSADHVWLSISQDAGDSEVKLTLRDDGTGFDCSTLDTEALYSSGRRGLAGMRRRAESLGGSWAIRSSHDDGTVIEVRVAL